MTLRKWTLTLIKGCKKTFLFLQIQACQKNNTENEIGTFFPIYPHHYPERENSDNES